jgi:hypothetical protein
MCHCGRNSRRESPVVMNLPRPDVVLARSFHTCGLAYVECSGGKSQGMEGDMNWVCGSFHMLQPCAHCNTPLCIIVNPTKCSSSTDMRKLHSVRVVNVIKCHVRALSWTRRPGRCGVTRRHTHAPKWTCMDARERNATHDNQATSTNHRLLSRAT